MRNPGGKKTDVWKRPRPSIYLKNFGIQFHSLDSFTPRDWKLPSFLRAPENYCAIIVIPLLNKQSQISLLIAERTSLWVNPIFIKYERATIFSI